MELVFEWDARKARANLRKHRISFDEAKTIFNDPLLMTYADELQPGPEERFLSLGLSARNRILLVVHTEREEDGNRLTIRLISCRQATPSERKFYVEGEI